MSSFFLRDSVTQCGKNGRETSKTRMNTGRRKRLTRSNFFTNLGLRVFTFIFIVSSFEFRLLTFLTHNLLEFRVSNASL